eukprot:353436-Chlamydomonas_euryale.AAC.9
MSLQALDPPSPALQPDSPCNGADREPPFETPHRNTAVRGLLGSTHQKLPPLRGVVVQIQRLHVRQVQQVVRNKHHHAHQHQQERPVPSNVGRLGRRGRTCTVCTRGAGRLPSGCSKHACHALGHHGLA